MTMPEFNSMPEPVRRVEVFTGAGRRRVWSAEEKAAIVAESYGAGASVCAVARHYGLMPSQLFAWRRLARRTLAETPVVFVPAVVETAPAEAVAVAKPPRQVRRPSKASGIELAIGGVEVRVGADASPRAIAAVIRALKAGA
jgi:transposase